MSFETAAFLKYAGAVNSNNNKPGPSFISDSKWKMQKWTGGFGWGVTDDVTLRAVWIQTHTQRGSSIYTSPAMFSFLNLLMQTFIIPFLSGYAFLFFDANLKWWCSSCRWLACQKTVVGFGFEAFIVFLKAFKSPQENSTCLRIKRKGQEILVFTWPLYYSASGHDVHNHSYSFTLISQRSVLLRHGSRITPRCSISSIRYRIWALTLKQRKKKC